MTFKPRSHSRKINVLITRVCVCDEVFVQGDWNYIGLEETNKKMLIIFDTD